MNGKHTIHARETGDWTIGDQSILKTGDTGWRLSIADRVRYLVPDTRLTDSECPIDADHFASCFIPEKGLKPARRGLMTLAALLFLSDPVISVIRDAGWVPLATLAAAVLLMGCELWWLRRWVRGYRNEPS